MKTLISQYEVLGYMQQGHKLHLAVAWGPTWLDNKNGLIYMHVHGNTRRALIRKGWIEKINTEETPNWRRDYVITEAGLAALEERG